MDFDLLHAAMAQLPSDVQALLLQALLAVHARDAALPQDPGKGLGGGGLGRAALGHGGGALGHDL